MKINHTTPQNLPVDDATTDPHAMDSKGKSLPANPPTPENSATSNRFSAAYIDDISPPNMPDTSVLAHYTATDSLEKMADNMLAAAKKILLTHSPASAAAARHKVIDLVVQEKFGNLLTTSEQLQIASALTQALSNDPIFCREVDRMLQLAAQKLNLD